MSVKPRWYQAEAIEAIFRYFQHYNGNPLVAMPTGTGKSLVIAFFIWRVLQLWPNQRFLIATHVKELVEQNASKILEVWPVAPVGINSAGLKQRDYAQPIIYAGIMSIKNCIDKIGWRDLLIIDEAHLLSQDETTTYQKVINGLRKINPNLKVIGLTATPYRAGQGFLTDEGLFTDICYDLTTPEAFSRLIAEGWLAPLVTRPTKAEINLAEVRKVNGEYSTDDLENETEKIIRPAIDEILYYGQWRTAGMIFASGIKTTEHVAEIIDGYGERVDFVHSKKSVKDNDRIITAFKRGELKYLVNYGKLTTGFDYPPVDLLGILRATTSVNLWVQMIGRGTRPSLPTNKNNCLVLDFGRNAERLGPINAPNVPRKKGSKKAGPTPVKICDKCGIYNGVSARFCGGNPYPTFEGCGYEFPIVPKITQTSSTAEVMKTDDMPKVEWFDVTNIFYSKSGKIGATPSLKVTYVSGVQKFDKFIHLEHTGLALHNAKQWWLQHSEYDAPQTVDNALTLTQTLKRPTRIKVWLNRQKPPYPEVLAHEF